MKQNTFVFAKDTDTDTAVQIDLTPLLRFGETLVSILVQPVSPISTPPLIVDYSPSSPPGPIMDLLLRQGSENISYGAQILVTTSARQLSATLAVSVNTQGLSPVSVVQDPDAYTDLVDTIQVGTGAIGTAVFMFPPGTDPVGGYVNWELFDANGTVYASGNAYDYEVLSNGLSNQVRARSIINIPEHVPESAFDTKYQLRYTLQLPEQPAGQQQVFYSAENVTVVGLTTTPLGTQDVVELRGRVAKTEVIIDGLYDQVSVSIYNDNTLIGTSRVTEYQRTGSGFYYAATFQTDNLVENLEPYSIVWNYSRSSDPSAVYTETANLWIVNPTILNAINDVKAKINKARTTLYGTTDMLFPPATILTWLRRARDAFNAAAGVFTSFTMTNAKGPIREYWLLYAELGAIEAQYMAEGEKAFDYSGAAISLNVDRTGYLDNMSSKIQGRLDNEIKPIKQNLVIKGNTGGDGSADPSKLRSGAIGAVGITITPASPWGPARVGLPYPSAGIIGGVGGVQFF